ncbi:MAG TPA: molybdopterin-dependent oxidoreductase [Anaerolineaceae bacterium]|nr:molybdopterin-dependent oxidoreductase [Anaerolineaceae bacterium]HPN50283.1 molybdopterin-dependent oxidoreductase [Anaerolineaceae bacterium]
MVHLKIDDKTIEVPEGTTVLNAAKMAGIAIPTLCDHPNLAPYGGCRLCVVEVEGARTLQPACTLPVFNNMVVRTATEKVRGARKFVLTLIFSERNHFCPYCQVSGGDCELQNAAYGEGMTHWPLQPNWQSYAVDASHPYFILDNNRCILCRRCVRACAEMVGNNTLGFEERGARSFLVADYGVPMGESTCISCGTCVQICPTGALIDRQSAYHGRETQVDRVDSICTGCSVGCNLEILTRDNNLVRIEGKWEAALNGGLLCEIGRFQPIEDTTERLSTPLVRKNGALKAATWDEALKAIADHSAGLAALASTHLSAEALYAFKQIFDGGSSLEEGAFTALGAAFAEEIGKSFESNLSALNSADCFLVLGENLVKDHQVAGFFVKRALVKNTGLVVVDGAENALTELADVVLKPGKGSDVDVLNGLLAALVKLGLSKAGLDAEKVLTAAVEKTGISADTFLDAARLLGTASAPAILFNEAGLAKAGKVGFKALSDLAQAIATPAVIGLKGGANSVAASQYHLDKPISIEGHKAVFVALGDEKPSQRLIQRLEGVSFLAVQSAYASQLTAKADVVLPVANWMEQDGHYVNLEGKLQAARKAIVPAEDVRTNEEALKALAAAMGVSLNDDWKAALTRRVSAVAIEA